MTGLACNYYCVHKGIFRFIKMPMVYRQIFHMVEEFASKMEKKPIGVFSLLTDATSLSQLDHE
jgi:hypothetical protein